MTKGRILHLEDEPEWLRHVRTWFGDQHDLYSATTKEDAAKLFYELSEEGLKVDLAIIDISLVLADAHDKKGLEFIDLLEEKGVLPGRNIIVLSGYSQVDKNWRVALTKYNVIDVFDKGDFPEEQRAFIELVNRTIDEARA